jgi:hypothetical protein
MRDVNTNTDAARIVQFQVELRILQELCVVCEQLMKLEQFRDKGLLLDDVKFDQRTGEAGIDSPWEEYSFTVMLECPAQFPAALAQELANPSKQGSGSATKEDIDKGLGRRLFPISVEDVHTAMRERPMVAGFDVPLDKRAEFQIPEGEKADTPKVKERAEALEREIESRVSVVLPVDAGIRAKALYFNKNWRGLNTEQSQ